MDEDYEDYCFEALSKTYPDYLKEIGFETRESIKALKEKKPVIRKEKTVVCKFCKKNVAVQRSQQMRSADEGETLLTYCRICDKTYQ